MPSVGRVQFSKDQAKKVEVISKQLVQALQQLKGIERLRSAGLIDFGSLDFSSDPELRYDDASALSSVLDNVGNIESAIDSLNNVIKW
jgi:hypothetical protein